jgi:hypothetical protein
MEILELFKKINNSRHTFVTYHHFLMMTSALIGSLRFNTLAHQKIDSANPPMVKISFQNIYIFYKEYFV